MIRAENATVYRGGGRRWFTLDAAARREAMAVVRERYPCECEHGEWDHPGFACDNHLSDARFGKMVRRVARLYVAAFRATT